MNKMISRRASVFGAWAILVLSGLPIQAADVVSIPDVAATAQHLVAHSRGTFSPFRGGTSNKMPDGPVAGNGDIGLVLGGSAQRLDLYIGKADFWGVKRGSIARVGWLELDVPELKSAASEVDQNIGAATLTGRFSNSEDFGLSFTTWVSTSTNLVVVELSNTGARPLSFSSKLFDGLGTSGNEATYGSGPGSTWLRVSPDTTNVSVGNRLSMGPRGGFQGKISDLKILGQALTTSDLAALDRPGAPHALFHWPTSGMPSDHGQAVEFAGGDKAGVSVGAFLLPQKQFSVTARVNATGAADLNFILSTMISAYGKGEHLPSQQRYQSGFALNLDRGRLSATLNYTTATASNLFPLNHWVQVAAIYDGTVLKLYQDGREVAATSAFPTAADVMGWDKTSIHTGDKDLPFAGCAPEGVLLQRVLGPAVREEQQALRFTLKSGEKATVVLSILTDRNTPDFIASAQRTAQQLDKDSLARLFVDHTKWWADFWSKSFIQIPDQKIQDNWYASLYLLACCSKPDCPAPGLWGNFITGDRMEWQGDYTLDYNYQAPFWAALPTNHVELADNYEQALLDQIPRGEAIAEHYHLKGIYWYCHLIPVPGWSDDYGTFWGQKSGSIFAVVNCAQRWRYTRDPAYARKIYPLLRGVADFWDNYLVLRNGRYVDIDDSSGENSGHDSNPATTIAFIRLVYPSLIEISRLLNVDPDRREKWNDVLGRLSPLPIVPADRIGAGLEKIDHSVMRGNLFIRNAEIGSNFPDPKYNSYQNHQETHSSAGMNSSQVVFPGWCIGLESDQRDRNAAYNTVLADAEWFDYNDDCTFYPSAAAVGIDPRLILENLHALLDTETPNFIFHTGGGGTEDFAVVPATLSLMFLQSYQENIHLFPNWPADKDASFGNLNACGGFLISSAMERRMVTYVKIQSNAGRECRLANPWPGEPVSVSSDKHSVRSLSGTLLKLPTQPGETLVLVPRP